MASSSLLGEQENEWGCGDGGRKGGAKGGGEKKERKQTGAEWLAWMAKESGDGDGDGYGCRLVCDWCNGCD